VSAATAPEKPVPGEAAPEKPPKKRRGAPPGNQYALKHGFYSRGMTRLEVKDLETALSTDLEDELALLKVMLRRAFDLSRDEDDPARFMAYLGEIGLAAIRISLIVKRQRDMGQEDAASQSINQALTEIMEEMKIYV
jgi:hypothetical protein